MLKKYLYLLLIFFYLFATSNIYANDLNNKYKQDPVYTPLYEDAPHPLENMLNMASNGDERAMYIIADLYSKGKGGFKLDLEKAKYWFEELAKEKNLHAFIRLAAIAKRQEKPIKAYSWYRAALKYGNKKNNKKLVEFIKKQQKLLIDNYE